MKISTSIWSVQHPNAGRNIQHIFLIKKNFIHFHDFKMFSFIFRHVHLRRVLGCPGRQVWPTSYPDPDVSFSLLLWISNIFCPLLWLGSFYQVPGWFLHWRNSTGNQSWNFFYPTASEASREVANLT